MNHKIVLPIYQNYHILAKHITQQEKKFIVMAPITEEEEEIIDDLTFNSISLVRGNKTFNISRKNVYCYGEVDFNDEDTLKKIDRFGFLDFLREKGVPVVSNYEYETHSCYSNKPFYLHSETWSPAELSKIIHGFLGKPKRIILFYYINK